MCGWKAGDDRWGKERGENAVWVVRDPAVSRVTCAASSLRPGLTVWGGDPPIFVYRCVLECKKAF